MISIYHPDRKIQAQIQLPSSKSISNRLLVLKALYFPELEIENLSGARDCEIMQEILERHRVLDVQDAGTVMRFMLAVCATRKETFKLYGTARMHERPVKSLAEALIQLGADIQYLETPGQLPVAITGGNLKASGVLDLYDVQSSQFVSAILMILPKVEGELSIRINPQMNSFAYVRLTMQVMEQCGFRFLMKEGLIQLLPERGAELEKIRVEEDYSSFFYWFSIAALAEEARLFFPGMSETDIQFERKFLQGLLGNGLSIEYLKDGMELTKQEGINFQLPQVLNFADVPDLAPTLILLATALDPQEYLIRGLQSLKFKESDREAVLMSYLAILGSSIQKEGNTWILDTQPLHVPEHYTFDVYYDHRMAMSLATLGVLQKVSLYDPEVVVKSYPGFWDDLKLANFVLNIKT